LNAARTSSQKICGCSQAAKWPITAHLNQEELGAALELAGYLGVAGFGLCCRFDPGLD
jgi:hypothetical protein